MEAQDLGGEDTVKASRGRRMGPGDGGEGGGSAVEPALLGPSCAAQQPPGLPGHQGWGREGVATPRVGVKMGERGRAEAAVWKGMGAAAAVFLLSTRIPAAGPLGKNLLIGSGLCLARSAIRGSWYQQALRFLPWPTSCHLLANRCSRGPI